MSFLFSIFPVKAGGNLAGETTIVKKVRGKVELQPPMKAWERVITTKLATNGDRIRTKESSGARLTMPDGSVIRMYEKTIIDISSVDFSQQSRKAKFKILFGKLKAKINKFVGKQDQFKIETPTATATIRGTMFEVFVRNIMSKETPEDIYKVTGEPLKGEAVTEAEVQEEAVMPGGVDEFLMEAPPEEKVDESKLPVIVRVTPGSGSNATSQKLLIEGKNFTGTTAVLVGDDPVDDFTIEDDANITAVVPSGISPGDYHIRIVKAGKSYFKVYEGVLLITSLVTGKTFLLYPGKLLGVGVEKTPFTITKLAGVKAGETAAGTTVTTATVGAGLSAAAIAAIVGGITAAGVIAIAASGGGEKKQREQSNLQVIVNSDDNLIKLIQPKDWIDKDVVDVVGEAPPDTTVSLTEPATGKAFTEVVDRSGMFTFPQVKFVKGVNSLIFKVTFPDGTERQAQFLVNF